MHIAAWWSGSETVVTVHCRTSAYTFSVVHITNTHPCNASLDRHVYDSTRQTNAGPGTRHCAQTHTFNARTKSTQMSHKSHLCKWNCSTSSLPLNTNSRHFLSGMAASGGGWCLSSVPPTCSCMPCVVCFISPVYVCLRCCCSRQSLRGCAQAMLSRCMD